MGYLHFVYQFSPKSRPESKISSELILLKFYLLFFQRFSRCNWIIELDWQRVKNEEMLYLLRSPPTLETYQAMYSNLNTVKYYYNIYYRNRYWFDYLL